MKKRLDAYLLSVLPIYGGVLMFLHEYGSLRGAHVQGEIAQLAGIIFIIGGFIFFVKLFYLPSLSECKPYAKLMVYLLTISILSFLFLNYVWPKVAAIYVLLMPFIIASYAKIKDFEK